ncbi:MAG TPA: phosphoribosylformylglycinamidine synthase subunit PurS [Acidimicrobiales bacterium]|nr:phosphoribosylformylglycinamidine synthase subunit PurS [Acidimicrobiales bacterium]
MSAFSVLVEVQLRPGIADPAGATIERSLPALGFGQVSRVRSGKAIRFELEADDEASARREVDAMCQRFLTNPVIEDATVRIAMASDDEEAQP